MKSIRALKRCNKILCSIMLFAVLAALSHLTVIAQTGSVIGNWPGNFVFRPTCLNIQGNMAYVGTGREQIATFDVTDPKNPILKSLLTTPGNLSRIRTAGTLAVGADGALEVFDLTSPSTPILKATYQPPGEARDVDLRANLAFLAIGDAGLMIVDLTDPAHPKPKGSLDTPGYANSVRVDGNLAFVGDSSSPQGNSTGLRIIDVTDPAAPKLLSSYGQESPAAMQVVGSRLFATTSSGFIVLDISNPQAPGLIKSKTTSSAALGISVLNGQVVLANAGGGLSIFDPSGASDWIGISGSPVAYSSDALSVALERVGNLLYVCDLNSGLRIMDMSNPSATVQMGSFNTARNAKALVVLGNKAYVLDQGLQVLDVSNPSAPVRIGGLLDSLTTAIALEVANNRAYVLTPQGVRIVNITDPLNLVIEGSYTPTNLTDARSMRLAWNTLFLGSTSRGFEVLDVSSPASPILKGSLPLLKPYDLQILGNMAFVINLGSDVQIIDVTDKTNPKVLSKLEAWQLQGAPERILLVGNLVYVFKTANVSIIDVSLPAAPVIKSTWPLPQSAFTGNLQLVGNLLFCAGIQGTQVADVRDPEHPFVIGSLDNNNVVHANAVQIVGNQAFVINPLTGLSILDLNRFQVPTLHSFRDTANVRVLLPSGTASSTVRLESTTDLRTGTWTQEPDVPVQGGSVPYVNVPIPNTTSSKFFRHRLP